MFGDFFSSTAPGTGHSPSFGHGVRYSCLPPQTWATQGRFGGFLRMDPMLKLG